jgi:streptogramin lyase
MLALEGLEGRQLMSRAIVPIATVRGFVDSNMVSGPGGDLWFATSRYNIATTESREFVERVGLNGSVASFPVPVPGPRDPSAQISVEALTWGVDGNLWFVANYFPFPGGKAAVIGKVSPTGVVTEFPPVPLPGGQQGTANGITNGPNGDLWFGYTVSEAGTNQPLQEFLGRVTTAGAVTLIPVSFPGSQSPSSFVTPISSADGSVWFTEDAGPNVALARMSAIGVVTTMPLANLASPNIASGPNGTFIVSGSPSADGQSEIFSVSTSGATTKYQVPSKISDAFGSYQDSVNGSLWFADEAIGPVKVGRISPNGAATSHNLSNVIRAPQEWVNGLVAGPSGKLYLLANSLARILESTATIYRITPSELSGGR